MTDKIPISFKVSGRLFKCEINPSNKERHFFDLLLQRGVREDDVANTFRENFQDEMDSATAEEVENFFSTDAILARYRNRCAKRRRSQQRSSEGDALMSPSTRNDNASPSASVVFDEPPLTPAAAPPTARPLSSSCVMTPDEVDELNRFIDNVLSEGKQQQQAHVTTGLESPSSPDSSSKRQTASNASNFAAAPTTPQMSATPRRSLIDPDRISVLLDVEGMESKKMIYVKATNTYQDVLAAVLRKLGCCDATLSFVDLEDTRIDLDDDDTLQLFLQMEESVKRLTLKCVPVGPMTISPRMSLTSNSVHNNNTMQFGSPAPTPPPSTITFTSSNSGTFTPQQDPLQQQQQQPPGRASVTQMMGLSGCGCVGAAAAEVIVTPTASVTTPSHVAASTSPSPMRVLYPKVKSNATHMQTFKGHSGAVYCCNFSPCGQHLISASRDRSVRLWTLDSSNTPPIVLDNAHNGFVLSCAYSPDGRHFVSTSDDQTIRMFSVDNIATTSNAQELAVMTLSGHTDKVYCAAYTTSGDALATCSCDQTVKVWDPSRGDLIKSVQPHDSAIFRIGLSHTDNGRHIVTSCDDHTSAIVDWKEGRIVRKLLGHGNTIWSASFSFDDRYVVTSSMDHTIKMWDVGSGREICTFHGHSTPVHSVMFCQKSRDTALVSCARDWTIGLWDVASTKLTQTYAGHTNTVYSIAQRDDMLLSSSLDESLKLWKLPNYNI
eukprot:PhM_4_TR586/c0_g1_i4/m.86349